jgi:hypothetical protein
LLLLGKFAYITQICSLLLFIEGYWYTWSSDRLTKLCMKSNIINK